MPSEAMSARDRWIDIAMATYEGSSQLCGFCGIYTAMGRMNEESKPCQSVEDFEKAVSESRVPKF